MKTILSPIDFSGTSLNALSFAAELSRRTSARLVIIHILRHADEEEEANNKLKSIESDLQTSFGSSLTCESFLVHGNLITALEKIIAVQQPDLIVMGTKGAGGIKKFLIGSNTVNVIAKTNVPVFAIPEVARFESFLNNGKNRVILATDLDLLENDKPLNVLKEIALMIIEPKLRVLSVRPKNTILSDAQRMERDFLVSFFNPEIDGKRITVFSSNVVDGINFYVSKKPDTGLIAMIARDSGQLIQKHYTREMASHTHLPLLVLHEA